MMNDGLKELADVSRYFGRDPEYVIAGGGNTSYKNDRFLWVKASGTSLATITEEGFAKLDRKCLEQISRKEYSLEPLKREAEIISELFNCVAGNSGLRPSVETSLHNLLNYSFVVHTHPTVVNGLMCSKNSAGETFNIFGDSALLVEYTDPGYTLFKLVEKRILDYKRTWGKDPQVIFLENHGVFVSADTTEEIKNLYKDITERIRTRFSQTLPSTEPVPHKNPLEDEVKALTGKTHVRSYFSDLIKEFTGSREAFSMVDTAFSPDNIVYCKAHYLFTSPDPKELEMEYKRFTGIQGHAPKVIAVENCGIICAEDSESSVKTVYEVFLDMMKISYYTRNFGGPRFLNREQINFIDTWEVENYRRKVAKGN